MAPRRLFGIALAVTSMLVGCGSIQPPAASVDGVKITDDQVAGDVQLFTVLSSLSQQTCGTILPGESAKAACTRAALSSLIQEAFIKRYAQENHITADPTEVKTSEDGLKTNLGGAAKVDPALEKAGVASAQFHDFALRIVLIRAVREDIGKGFVSDAQLMATYEQNIQQYTLLHAEHILVKSRAQAEQIYRRVTRPGFTEQNFLALAKKVSIDPSAKQNSGDLGSIGATSLDPTFVQAAEALKPGEISKPVQTSFGWHVIRLVATSATPFDTLKSQLTQEASAKAFDAWFTTQLEAADIQVNPKYGRWNAEFKVVLPIRSTATGTPAPSVSSSVAATPST